MPSTDLGIYLIEAWLNELLKLLIFKNHFWNASNFKIKYDIYVNNSLNGSHENYLLCSHCGPVNGLDSELLYKAIKVVLWTTTGVTMYKEYNVNDIVCVQPGHLYMAFLARDCQRRVWRRMKIIFIMCHWHATIISFFSLTSYSSGK